MKICKTKFDDVFLIETNYFTDNRGFFTESYNEKTFFENDLKYCFVQDSHSYSIEANTIRGLHYQVAPKQQSKLIRVLVGAIFDVVVDLRKDSKTFGQWESYILSSENRKQLLVPKGFAHGFCTLKSNTEVLYKVDEYYSPSHDKGIVWNDMDLNIKWPTDKPILSDKDKHNPTFKEAINNLENEG